MKLNRISTQLAASALMLILPFQAHAAGLGKLTVNSALGQPLSAEIELLAVDKGELDSLNAALASGQAYKDAQIEFAPVLSTLQFAIEQKTDGRPVLKVTSSRPVNDPFLDMLIELNWSAGRLVREYTVLLDPPGVGTSQVVTPITVSPPVAQAPQTTAPAPATAAEAQPATPSAGVAKPVAKAEAKKPAQREEATPEQEVSSQAAAKAAEAAAPTSVHIKRGDTLAGIANRVKPSHVSLDQALVSLFKENTQAFDGNNMNRLKAGKTLTIPSAESMVALDTRSATREVRLQAADWRAYRAKLADQVAASAPASKESAKESGQISVGKITPKVEDQAKPAEEAKDVLKLSKAATPPAAATKPSKEDEAAKQASAAEKAAKEQEDLAAREKSMKESADRVASLEKQIQDMQDLVQLKDQAQPGAEKPAAPAPTPKVQATPPVEQPKGNWYEPMLENPLYWGGGLAALGLGGLLWWMAASNRRRKATTQQFEDSLMTKGLFPNTVMGATSGGAVNTGDTSFLTDFSQAGLGSIDTQDVDPIAEAEVYMAYGRDAQAEEILKEALNKTPERHEIRVKLLEIYAARKNTSAFESVAKDLHAALEGRHTQLWERAAELGRSIDPENPLYGGTPAKAEAPVAPKPEAGAVVAGAMGVAAAVTAATAVEDSSEERPDQTAAEEPIEANQTTTEAPQSFETPGDVLDFDLQIPELQTPQLDALANEAAQEALEVAEPVASSSFGEAAAAASAPADLDQGLEFDLSGLDIKTPEEDDTDFNMDEADALSADGKMDFSGLDLNLDEVGGEDSMDEVATKLDLARAYLEMGDKEGAREILQEVLSEGNDRQQNDARSIMAAM